MRLGILVSHIDISILQVYKDIQTNRRFPRHNFRCSTVNNVLYRFYFLLYQWNSIPVRPGDLVDAWSSPLLFLPLVSIIVSWTILCLRIVSLTACHQDYYKATFAWYIVVEIVAHRHKAASSVNRAYRRMLRAYLPRQGAIAASYSYRQDSLDKVSYDDHIAQETE